MKKVTYFLFTKSIGLYINLMGLLSPKKAVRLAFQLFSEPREGKISKENMPAILQNVTSETFEHEGCNFQAYVWEGNENKILLVHGWESNASRWANILPFLKKSGSTIIAIDGPAHGLSSGKEFSIPQYAEFIHRTVDKYKPQYLIGHSIGGKTCLYYQYLYPNEDIKKMVILGAPSDFTIILKNYINILSLNSRIAKDLEEKYARRYKQKLEDFSGRKFASVITTKGLIAHDVDDTVVSINEAKKIAEVWTNAKLIETKGLGHSMHDDNLYENIYQFLFDN
ncbi:alpha/beta fold hydrolase [Flavobacterium sp. GCM10027622]|uniref:alpha/beta fold hydrolase n=1 Tax=unclassified Flavobacterium TaxID=196869 RepID=UPI00360E7BD1